MYLDVWGCFGAVFKIWGFLICFLYQMEEYKLSLGFLYQTGAAGAGTECIWMGFLYQKRR